MKATDIHKALLNMDGLLDGKLPTTFLNGSIFTDICLAAMAILFLCLLIRFVVDCLEIGYSSYVLKKYLLQMMILGAILSPVAFKALAGLYLNLFDTMMTYIGNRELGKINEAMLAFSPLFTDMTTKLADMVFGIGLNI